MRCKFLLPVLLCGFASTLPLQAQEKSTDVSVALVTEDSVVQWDPQDKMLLNLVFKNNGTEPVELQFPDRHITLNGVLLSIADGEIAAEISRLKPLQAGETRQISYNLRKFVSGSGVYYVGWGKPLDAGHLARFYVLRHPTQKMDEEDQTAIALVHKIRQRLPAGWVADYVPNMNQLEVTRLGPSATLKPYFHPSLHLPHKAGASIDKETRPTREGPYTFSFQVYAYYSPERRQKVIQAEAERLREAEAHVALARTFGRVQVGKPKASHADYQATVPAQEGPLRKYHELMSQNKPVIVEFSYGKASFTDSSNDRYLFSQKAIQEECESVKRMVTELMTPY